MDRDFQDRIDEYLLHADTMSEEAKAEFLKEIEADDAKKEQYEFTISVRKAVASRGEKLKAMAEFQKLMETAEGGAPHSADALPESLAEEHKARLRSPRKRTWLWLSGVAALLVVGFFAVRLAFVGNSPDGNVRGGDDVFDVTTPTDNKKDSIKNDTVKAYIIDTNHE